MKVIDGAALAALLARRDAGRVPEGGGYQAQVRLFPDYDPPIVVKAPRSGWGYRLSRALIRREYRVYQRLRGVPGVPACYGLFNGEWLVLAYVPGVKLRRRYLQAPGLPRPHPGVVGLRRTVAALHRRGVAHADLKRHDNLILGPDEQLYVVDFGTAALRAPKRRGGPLWRWAAQQDWNAWARHGWGRKAGDMPPAVARLARRTLIERWAKAVRNLYR